MQAKRGLLPIVLGHAATPPDADCGFSAGMPTYVRTVAATVVAT